MSEKSACHPQAWADKPPSFVLPVVAEWAVADEIGEWLGSSLLCQRMAAELANRRLVLTRVVGVVPKKFIIVNKL